MKKIVSIFGAIVSLLTVSACQTAKYAGDDYAFYQSIIVERCGVATYQDASVTQPKKQAEELVTVLNVEAGNDGWKRIDATTDGFRDNVYYNSNTRESVCGWREWRQHNLPVTFDKL